MAFHEVRLPSRLAFGSTGGVERRTEVVTLGSGHERRSSPWASSRRRYLIAANLRSLDDMATLIAFFEARRGRLHGFRFKDFSDFKSCMPGAEVAPLDQILGVGDGEATGFQLCKTYGADETAWKREITKPVEGSVRVSVNGVEGAAFSVDASSGVISFEVPPSPGEMVRAGFEFDTPVRFDVDRIDMTLETFEAGRMAALPLIEIRI